MTVRRTPAWLEGLDPPVPAPFAPWLDRSPGRSAESGGVGGQGSAGGRPSVDALLDGALGALDDALGEGREPRSDREGAFELLAADGLLTYACEEALDGVDPEEALRRLVAGVAAAWGEPGDG